MQYQNEVDEERNVLAKLYISQNALKSWEAGAGEKTSCCAEVSAGYIIIGNSWLEVERIMKEINGD